MPSKWGSVGSLESSACWAFLPNHQSLGSIKNQKQRGAGNQNHIFRSQSNLYNIMLRWCCWQAVWLFCWLFTCQPGWSSLDLTALLLRVNHTSAALAEEVKSIWSVDVTGLSGDGDDPRRQRALPLSPFTCALMCTGLFVIWTASRPGGYEDIYWCQESSCFSSELSHLDNAGRCGQTVIRLCYGQREGNNDIFLVNWQLS